MKRLVASSILFALWLVAGSAGADIIGTWSNTTAFVVGDNEACAPPILIPLTTGGATTRTFVTTRDNQRIVATYSAECSVKAPNTTTWLNLDILVDGAAAAPTSDDNAFCTSRGNNVLDGWVSASTTAVIVVAEPGFHSIQVRGSLIGCSDVAPRDDQYRLDDSTLVLHSN